MNYIIDQTMFNGLGTISRAQSSSDELPITIRVVHAKGGDRYCSSDSRSDSGSLGHDAHAVYELLNSITDGCTAVHDISAVRDSMGWDHWRLSEAFRELGCNGFMISRSDMGAPSEAEKEMLSKADWEGCYLFLAESVRDIDYLDDYFAFCAESWGEDTYIAPMTA